MGLTNKIKIIFVCMVLNVIFIQPIAAKDITLEVVDWPTTEVGCQNCVNIRFLALNMQIPLDLIDGLEIINADANLVIKPSYASKGSILFLSIPEENQLINLIRGSSLFDDIDINNHEELFDLIGYLPTEGESVQILRRMKNIDIAKRYTKTSKDSVHAYWIQTKNPENNQSYSELYIVIDDKTVYDISGEISQELYNAILSNLEIVPLHIN